MTADEPQTTRHPHCAHRRLGLGSVEECGTASSARITHMSREHSPVFRLVDLRKVYGQGEAAVHALRGVDLEVAEGELLVLLGPSGSGKSTLLNVVGGLDRPTGGRCFLRGNALGRGA